ncbi:hypothetical protein KCMC57_up53870 [Kitasatospora sp. CMC57]|uniref:Uncharacterized protein n=1 Tax=Kitasatospora sp. CMC57 TaxID=3231513 RepID=A0AB33K2G3_9ACTN
MEVAAWATPPGRATAISGAISAPAASRGRLNRRLRMDELLSRERAAGAAEVLPTCGEVRCQVQRCCALRLLTCWGQRGAGPPGRRVAAEIL